MNATSIVQDQSGDRSSAADVKASPGTVQPLIIQRKLSVGKEDDEFEREADTTADRVMRMPETNFVQRKCDECKEEETLHRKTGDQNTNPFIQTKANGNSAVSESVSSSIQSSRGGGSPIDRQTQSFMSNRMDSDFSKVKIHTNSEAVQLNRELNAKAFTVGNDIYFNEGQYQPESSRGKKLLAHELTHIRQQGSGIIRRCVNPAKNDPLYDAVAKQIKAKPAYTALADKTVADGIITDAKKKAGCLYYAGKLKQLFDTPEKAAADVVTENKAVTVEAVKEEKVRVAKPEAAKNLDLEKKAADAVPAANWKSIKGKFGGGTYQVDSTNPANIIVKAKVFLKPTGTGTPADVANIKQMHDGIEKAASMKGFIVSIEFVDVPDANTFTAKVHQEGWTDAENWSAATPKTLAHEFLHMLAFEIDRYNYIESHATNQSMKIPDRLHWFAVQLTKPPGFDNDLSIMSSGEHPLDDDACRVAGLDLATCVAVRRRVKP